MVGTWRNAQRGGVLVFRADGTFTANHLPYQVFDHLVGVLPSGFDKKLDRIDVAGTWELEGDPREPGKRRSHIRLSTDGTGTSKSMSGLELFAQWQGSAIVLAFFFGDPDCGQSTCPPHGTTQPSGRSGCGDGPNEWCLRGGDRATAVAAACDASWSAPPAAGSTPEPTCRPAPPGLDRRS